jgi:UDP-N-acetylmuramyl pentapeptide synthase
MLHLHRVLPDVVRGPHASSLRELEELLRAYLQPGDILTIKASTPIGLGRLASSLKFAAGP